MTRTVQDDRLEAGLIGSGRMGNVRLRGEAIWEFAPTAGSRRQKSAPIGRHPTMRIGKARSVMTPRTAAAGPEYPMSAASIRSPRRPRSKAERTEALPPASTSTSRSIHRAAGFKLTNQRLATTGSVEARVYRDFNDNGVRDLAEPWEEGALITTGQRVSEEKTDKNGAVRVGGLQPYQAVAVGIDTSSLSDPSLTPKKALQVIVPRPGVAAHLEIGLVGAGDIEGVLVQDDGRGFEGLDIELVDASGKAVGNDAKRLRRIHPVRTGGLRPLHLPTDG